MATELTILGAAWGPSDVTEKVQGLVQGQRLSITADTSALGDTWVGVRKSLVVFYHYSSRDSRVVTAAEGDTIELSPPTDVEALLKADRIKELLNPDKIAALADITSDPAPLHILGAAYGLGDVTQAARKKVQQDTTFSEPADNATWGDHWEGVPKTLVVAYKHGDNGAPMLSIVKENEYMSLSDPPKEPIPPLFILGASNGPADATELAQQHVKNHELMIESWLGYDPMPGTIKTEVVVYRYGNGEVQMSYSADFIHTGTIKYDGKKIQPRELESTNPHTLTILKAMYWTIDVTENCKALVSNNELHIRPSQSYDGDPKVGTKKTLVVVYQYGSDKPQIKIATNGEYLNIDKNTPPPTYSGLISAKELLEGGDTIALRASNGKYVTSNDQQKLVASMDQVHSNSSSFLAIELHDENLFRMLTPDGNYVVVGKDKSLYASTQSKNEGALFYSAYSRDGSIRLSTYNEDSKSYAYVRLHSKDNSLRADSTEYFSENTAFDVAMEQTGNHSSRTLEELSLEELDELKYYQDFTLGFFKAMGLGPYFSENSETEILDYINGNAAAKAAMIHLAKAANSAPNIPLIIPHAIKAIKVLYRTGVLWKIIKLYLKSGGWLLLTRVVAKTIVVVFLPENEIALLLVSLGSWAEIILKDVKNK